MIRTSLCCIRPPPQDSSRDIIIQTINHLITCFPDTENPIIAFHITFQHSFL
jgi:hypothetical protein